MNSLHVITKQPTLRQHALRACYISPDKKNHADPWHLHRFLCISLIFTRNFNGSNPDGSLALANAYWAVWPCCCPLWFQMSNCWNLTVQVLSLPVSNCVSVCVYQSWACPCDNSSPIQAITTKFGQKIQQSGTKPNLVAKILATKFGGFFVIHVMFSKICSIWV